jgi:hypothetical protein
VDRFDRFTEGARQVLTEAQTEALRLQQNYIGTEHLLLGLLGVDKDLGTTVLRNLGMDLPMVRGAVDFILDRGGRPILGEIGLTLGAKRVIELSLAEARAGRRGYVATEHLLLGLMRVGDGIAAGVLESLGLEISKVRKEIDRLAPAPPPTLPARMPFGPESVAIQLPGLYADIAADPLRLVLGIGQIEVDGGVSVELIALEIREGGCLLYWKAHPRPERPLGEPYGAVSDDAGTTYTFRRANLVATDRETKGEIVIAPAPPAGATSMQVVLRGFSTAAVPAPIGGGEVRGTWRFEIRLQI